nr:response regulator [Pontibacter harenae]
MPSLGRVLLVEDDEVTNFVNKAVLQDHATQIVTAENGEDALSLIRKTPFKLVLLDLEMPYMGGVDFLKALSEVQESTGLVPPVVVVVSILDSELGEGILKEYPIVKGYLDKPLTDEHVPYLASLLT